MTTLRLVLLLSVAFFSLIAYGQSEVVYQNCKDKCMAKTKVNNLKKFKIPATPMGNPLGAYVCTEQLKGNVAIGSPKQKPRCFFDDGSAVELHSLHVYSEKFVIP